MSTDAELITAEELAHCIRVRPDTIRRWASEGRIPVVKVNSKIHRFDRRDVIEALKNSPEAGVTSGL